MLIEAPSTHSHWTPLLGRLGFDALPTEPIVMVTLAVVALGGLGVVGAITYYLKLWGYLWTEWFTSVDHKKIGVMYIVLALVMLLRGFADAIMMRAQQALAFGAV